MQVSHAHDACMPTILVPTGIATFIKIKRHLLLINLLNNLVNSSLNGLAVSSHDNPSTHLSTDVKFRYGGSFPISRLFIKRMGPSTGSCSTPLMAGNHSQSLQLSKRGAFFSEPICSTQLCCFHPGTL